LSESRKALVHDSQGNTISVVGPATLQKRNPTGALVWDFALPVQDENHVVRAIAIDAIDRLYVGVSEGGTQTGAWIRCYELDRDKKLVKVWDERPGGYTEKLVIREDKLYAAQNFTDSARSRYVVYEDLANRAGPTESVVVTDLPYPVHDLSVNKTGEVLTASAAVDALTRYTDPRVPLHSIIRDSQRWNPTMLPEWEKRKWVWLEADKLDLDDGDDVVEWADTGGRGLCRMRKDATDTRFKAPRFKKNGLGYKPAVHFDGNWYRMVSDASVGITENLNDVQPTLFPGKGRGFLVVMVIQPAQDSSKIGRLFAQVNTNTGDVRRAFINANTDGTPPGAALAGAISLSTAAQSSGSSPQTAGVIGYYTNNSGAAILSVAYDNEQGGAGFTNGFFRVNGVPISNFDCNEFWTAAGTFSFLGCEDDGAVGPICGISEFFVLQSYDDPTDDLHKICTFPNVDATAGTGTHDVSTSDTEIERIESYFAAKYGLSHLLDRGDQASTVILWDSEGGASEFGHAFSNNPDAVDTTPLVNPNGRDTDTWDVALMSHIGITAKWSSQRGNVKWAYQDAGMGLAVAATSESAVYTVGPRTNSATSGDNASGVRKLTDNGSSVTYGWAYFPVDGSGNAVDYSYRFPRVAVDTFDNLWLPFHFDDATTQYTLLGFSDASATPFLSYEVINAPSPYAVSTDPRVPDYSTQPATIERPEFVVVATDNEGDASANTLHQVRVVNAVNNNASSRTVKNVAVANGNIKTFTSAGAVAIVGSGSLDATARWIAGVPAFNKAFFADGKQYRVFDPKTGLVTEWAATDGGAMLPRYQLLTLWRGRMVLARGPDTPFNFQMSEYGNPFGWDLFPPDGPLATQAVNGQQHEVGQVPDIINTLIPHDRERLIFGCDHTIYALWGDPMENGSIVLLSDITGMAYGQPHARDSEGNTYFFGTRGGVYAMSTSFSIKKLSGKTIDRRLQHVDMALYHLTLVWDEDQQELRVWQTPQQLGGALVDGWAWCKRTGSWHQDAFSATDVQPTCAAVFDSDSADDRTLVVGCEDGYVRRIDRDARDDDGYRIASHVVFGPFTTGADHNRLRNPKLTLASELDGARVELFSSDSPSEMGVAQASMDLGPGQNPRMLAGVRGAYTWIRLSNGATGQAWAYESGSAEVYQAGRKVAT
jgi:hypothetical protein